MNSLIMARLTKKLTKKEVAEKAGITPAMYSYIESGERSVDIETSKKIAKALGKKHEDIFLPSRLTVREVIIQEVE
ncbi:helix-turn-helix transcriptional regulator [Pseudalkalibacillus caeni]|uniref:Helix-turn-helix transcriptional regulator n=1 Tax=Exobacillus caeni TaxID=2574798 RepID=A0A5R9FA81_9BACL|nr:helix-turn-helix transcriptional regulator [Pseudalkalibacillus caeni]TLS37773.1 helix-turn-helix transcriptional regulator [Pseudalkalibacillus caeni]